MSAKLSKISQRTLIPWPIVVIVLVGAALVAVGGFIGWFHPAGLLPKGEPVTNGVRIYGVRLADRNLALAAMLLVLLALHAHQMLACVMVVNALVQLADIIAGIVHSDAGEMAGALVVMVAFIWGASRLRGQAPWHLDFWRDPGPATR
jgi:hypothetical protein